ncbi:1,2-phenylacetyl-CoA epoxidase subunit PaaC [Malikia spinosa]|uniref:1,2-phenylacetyl-CoA epoxidase subunit PaaC n=1 Tax=Malikia spinosa TaxID=86180 RepID=UPI003FA21A9F
MLGGTLGPLLGRPGPGPEDDTALPHDARDLLGQPRLLSDQAATELGGDATEDRLAYFRDVPEFRNYTLLELPHHSALVGYAKSDLDYGTTIVRNFLYSALMVLVWEQLQQSKDEQLAAIAAKSLKEVRYHLRHSRDWLVRLGDGTDDSHARVQAALDHLMPYTQEFWTGSSMEAAAVAAGVGVDVAALKSDWDQLVDDALLESTLQRPKGEGYVTQGKNGLHSEHLGFLLSEMQGLARSHPTATW